MMSREDQEERQWLHDLDWLSSQAQGRRILSRLIVNTGCFMAKPGGNDYALGRESVGQEFLGLLAFHFPDRLASMLVENKPVSDERRSEHDGRADRSDTGADASDL